MYYLTNDYELTSLANAIRTATYTGGLLEFPNGFISAFSGLESWPSIEPLSDGDIIGYVASRVAILSNTFRGSLITFASFPRVSIMSSTAFSGCLSLKAVAFNNLEVIPVGAFLNCSALEYANFPACVKIDLSLPTFGSTTQTTPFAYNAFYNCTVLKELKLPNIPSLPDGLGYWLSVSGIFSGEVVYTEVKRYVGTFPDLSLLEKVDLQNCITIGSYTFYNCPNLNQINIPNCKYIHESAFYGCGPLNLELNNCLLISNYAFRSGKIKAINLPKCQVLGMHTFADCSNLTIVEAPNCINANVGTFYNCNNLTQINLPQLQRISYGMFESCTKLTIASFANCSFIDGHAFDNCNSLISLYLTSNSLVTLISPTYCFSKTPIIGYSDVAGRYGSIYVPKSLVGTYKADPVWSYFSSRFVGI